MKTYDYIVIGGGSGGIASANRAGMHGANVLLLRATKLVGPVSTLVVCLKVMWQASSMMEMMERDTAGYGFDVEIKILALNN